MAKFSERIDFVKVETVEDEKGIRKQVEIVEYSCWCNILSRSMSEIAKAYTTNTELLYSFRTRYCRFTKALELDTRTYKIKYLPLYLILQVLVSNSKAFVNRQYLVLKE